MKNQWLKLMLMAGFLGAALPAVADDEATRDVSTGTQVGEADLLHRSGTRFTLMGGAELQRALGTNSDVRKVFTGGITVDRFLTPTNGIFISLQGADRGFKIGDKANTAAFVDFIMGFSSRYNWDLFSDAGVLHYRVGAFFGMPVSDFSGNLAGSLSNYSKTMAGFYIDLGSMYPIGQDTALGYRIYAKEGITDAIATPAGQRATFDQIGVALELTF